MIVLDAVSRVKTSKGENGRLRRQGRLPAIVYGGGEVLGSVHVDHAIFLKSVVNSDQPFFDLKIEDRNYPVLVRSMQKHPINDQIIHVDFLAVSQDRPVEAKVTLKPIGISKGVREGGVLQILVRSLTVRCLPQNMPSELEIDVTNLVIGDSLMAKHIKLSEGVELCAELNTTVITVILPQRGTKSEDAGTDAKEEGST